MTNSFPTYVSQCFHCLVVARKSPKLFVLLELAN